MRVHEDVCTIQFVMVAVIPFVMQRQGNRMKDLVTVSTASSSMTEVGRGDSLEYSKFQGVGGDRDISTTSDSAASGSDCC